MAMQRVGLAILITDSIGIYLEILNNPNTNGDIKELTDAVTKLQENLQVIEKHLKNALEDQLPKDQLDNITALMNAEPDDSEGPNPLKILFQDPKKCNEVISGMFKGLNKEFPNNLKIPEDHTIGQLVTEALAKKGINPERVQGNIGKLREGAMKAVIAGRMKPSKNETKNETPTPKTNVTTKASPPLQQKESLTDLIVKTAELAVELGIQETRSTLTYEKAPKYNQLLNNLKKIAKRQNEAFDTKILEQYKPDDPVLTQINRLVFLPQVFQDRINEAFNEIVERQANPSNKRFITPAIQEELENLREEFRKVQLPKNFNFVDYLKDEFLPARKFVAQSEEAKERDLKAFKATEGAKILAKAGAMTLEKDTQLRTTVQKTTISPIQEVKTIEVPPPKVVVPPPPKKSAPGRQAPLNPKTLEKNKIIDKKIARLEMEVDSEMKLIRETFGNLKSLEQRAPQKGTGGLFKKSEKTFLAEKKSHEEALRAYKTMLSQSFKDIHNSLVEIEKLKPEHEKRTAVLEKLPELQSRKDIPLPKDFFGKKAEKRNTPWT